jgi:hypothetical protein
MFLLVWKKFSGIVFWVFPVTYNHAMGFIIPAPQMCLRADDLREAQIWR